MRVLWGAVPNVRFEVHEVFNSGLFDVISQDRSQEYDLFIQNDDSSSCYGIRSYGQLDSFRYIL